MVKGFLNGFHDKFDIHNWRCLHHFATKFYSWFTEKENYKPFRTHVARNWSEVNLNNLILTSFKPANRTVVVTSYRRGALVED